MSPTFDSLPSEKQELAKSLLPVLQFIKTAHAQALTSEEGASKLQQELNAKFGASGEVVQRITRAIVQGERDGWVCKYEAGGIRYGRVIKPEALLGQELGDFSVDIVEMNDVVGPAHEHPKGEVDLLIPLTGAPAFDGNDVDSPWTAYAAGSVHSPTVTGGKAFVLYLLAGGEIKFQ